MPHAIRIFRQLRAINFDEPKALAIAAVFERAKTEGSAFVRESILDELCEAGLSEVLAEAIADVARPTFPSERFRTNFLRTPLKTALVRAKLPALHAEAFLDAVEPCVVALKTRESRAPVPYSPGPGRVVMCDFRFLKVPEMQKERRAIVVSSRQTKDPGRVTVVPVSMTPPHSGDTCNHKFEPGAYPFFHKDNPVWAICDHVYTVSLTRLWQINVALRPSIPQISADDLAAVRLMVATNLGS
jgi:uncharacterized protein YifN (PemK superfamily)